MEFDNHRFDMVRSGIITYGLYPSEQVNKAAIKLKPALQWKAHVINVNTVDAGNGVSYGKTYITKSNTKIATLSVGYADGYPRALSSKARVLIHGEYAQIIGRICMDQMMVDVTHIDNVNFEDEVTLVGEDGNNIISVEELADMAGSFNYEFVCGIGTRVKRVYDGFKCIPKNKLELLNIL
jgi:alanine racemase